MSKYHYLILGNSEEDFWPYGILSTKTKAQAVRDQIDGSSIVELKLDQLQSEGILWFCAHNTGLISTLTDQDPWTIEPIPFTDRPLNSVTVYGQGQPWEKHFIYLRAATRQDAIQKADSIITDYLP